MELEQIYENQISTDSRYRDLNEKITIATNMFNVLTLRLEGVVAAYKEYSVVDSFGKIDKLDNLIGKLHHARQEFNAIVNTYSNYSSKAPVERQRAHING